MSQELCECRNYQEYQSPCTHVIAACRHIQEDPFDYFAVQYTTTYYRRTYQHSLQPISIKNLVPDPRIKPPVFKKQRKRPKVRLIFML
jgi:hypothetical protein